MKHYSVSRDTHFSFDPTPTMQEKYCATDLPQWNYSRNPEHQTRRHLENAAEARMKILRRRLLKQQNSQRPPFISSPWRKRVEREVRRSFTPERGRSPLSRSGVSSIGAEGARTRPRSASPLGGGKANLLTNDFVQWAPTGVYRNLEQRWEMDHLSVSDRLDKISSLCREFKHQYKSNDEGTDPVGHHQQIINRSQSDQRLQDRPKAPSFFTASTMINQGKFNDLASHSRPLSPPHLTARLTAAGGFNSHSLPRPSNVPASTKTIVSRPRAHLHSPPAISQPMSHSSLSPPAHTLRPPSSPHHLFSTSKDSRLPSATQFGYLTSPQKPTPLAFGQRVIPAALQIAEDRASLHETSKFLTESHPRHLEGARSFPSMQAEADSITSTSRKDDGLDRFWPEVFKGTGDSKHPRSLYTLPDMLPQYASPVSLVPKSSTLKFELRTRSPQRPPSPDRTALPLEGLRHRERLQAGIRELQAEMSRLRDDLSVSVPEEDLAATIPGLGWAVRVPPREMSPQKIWG